MVQMVVNIAAVRPAIIGQISIMPREAMSARSAPTHISLNWYENLTNLSTRSGLMRMDFLTIRMSHIMLRMPTRKPAAKPGTKPLFENARSAPESRAHEASFIEYPVGG